MKGKGATWFLVLFGLFWSALTLVFDVINGRALSGQIRSTRFVVTEGRIVASEVNSSSDSDGTSYKAKVTYLYSILGQRYESSRVCFGQMGTSDGTWARQTVRDNPVGASRTVFYNPTDPTEAVLQPGVGGQELFMTLFLAPFNAVMIGIWWLAVNLLRPDPPYGGAKIQPDSGDIRVRFSGVAPIAAALGVGGLTAFVCIFPLALPHGFSPPLGLTIGAWAVVAVAALWTLMWQLRRNLRNEPDLLISPGRGTLTRLHAPQPAALGMKTWREWKTWRHTPVVVPLEQIRAVEVREHVSTSTENETRTHFVVIVTNPTGAAAPVEVELAMWNLADHANAFAAWLRTTLGLG